MYKARSPGLRRGPGATLSWHWKVFKIKEMVRVRFKWIVLTILWSASMSEVSAEKAEVCSMPHAEKGDCRATKIKYTYHAEQDR